MVFEKLINDNLSEKTDVKLQLKDFLEAKVVEDVKKKELEPLSNAVADNVDFDERLESDMNVTHVTNLLEAMKDNLKPTTDTPEARKQAYMNAYTKRGKAYTMGVQSGLKLMGFDLGSHEIDGERGENTEKAIAQFQEWQGIDVDKRAGFDTISKMLEVGITTKAPAEVITKEPVLKKKTPTVEMNPDFYTTHTEFTEKEFGKVKNKVYKVEKIGDIPTTIAKDTVINFGSYYIFSNGKVYDYGTDGKTLVRKGDRSELDDSGKWKVTTKEVVKDPVKVPDNKVDVITSEDMTFDQLQVNLDSIWSKYFTFDQQWQKDFITEYRLDKGISVEANPNGILVRSKGSSYYLFNIDQSKYTTTDGKINTKEVISLVKKDIVEQMENKHYRAMLKDKIDSKYATWDQIFTKEELADTTSEQGKKIQEFITSFSKNGATVNVGKKSGEYMINRANGKLYFNYTFKTKNKEKRNSNDSVVTIGNIINEKGEFNQKKWNSEVRNMIFQKKLTHPYFTKYEKVDI